MRHRGAVLCLLVASAGAGGAAPSYAHAPAPSRARTYRTGATKQLKPGTLRIRATRVTSQSVRVTAILRVTATAPTSIHWTASPCTKNGCIDTGGQSVNFALSAGARTVQRTVTVTRTSHGAIACITLFPIDVGPVPISAGQEIPLRGGTVNGAELCPPMR